MRLFVRLTLVGLLALTALGFWFTQQPKSGAVITQPTVSAGLCEGNGTSLVIDFGTDNPKETISKCVQNYSGNSWNLFEAAGLKITGTQKYPVGFVCRIEGFPNKSIEPCTETPGTTNGSWAFYIATDQSWEYSSYGASTHKTKCGQAEGWRYLLPGEEITEVPRIEPLKNNCEKQLAWRK